MSHDASREYWACLAARNATREALNESDARFAHARLATFAAALLLAIFIWRGALSPWWLLAPAAIFAWLVRRHDRVLRARDAAIRGIAFYDRGLARLEDRWSGTGEPGERFRDGRSAPRFASRTRCWKDTRDSMPKSRESASWRIPRREPCRCSSCSTSCSTAPTRTTDESAPPACSGACSIAVPSD